MHFVIKSIIHRLRRPMLIKNDNSHTCFPPATERFPNLYNYVMRVKDTVWPDWDDCISTGPWALKQQT